MDDEKRNLTHEESSHGEWPSIRRWRQWWSEKLLPRYREINRKYLGLPRLSLWGLVLLIVGVIGFYSDLSPFRQSRQMTGDFRVAVAAFEVMGDREARQLGDELAQGVFLRMEQAFDELSLDFTIEIWGPAEVGTISGATQEERAYSALHLSLIHI